MQCLASCASWRSCGASSRIPAKVTRPVTPSGAKRSSLKNGTRGRRPSLPRRPYIVGRAASSHIVVPAILRILQPQPQPLPCIYSVTKIKLLAIVETLKEFKGMLWGQPIKVYTDHKNLMRDALCLSSDWVYQWRLLLEEYRPKIVYIKGIHNIVSDAISRLEYDPSIIKHQKVILHQKSAETQEAFKDKTGWQSQNIGVN